jgi:hypothetical protein
MVRRDAVSAVVIRSADQYTQPSRGGFADRRTQPDLMARFLIDKLWFGFALGDHQTRLRGRYCPSGDAPIPTKITNEPWWVNMQHTAAQC